MSSMEVLEIKHTKAKNYLASINFSLSLSNTHTHTHTHTYILPKPASPINSG